GVWRIVIPSKYTSTKHKTLFGTTILKNSGSDVQRKAISGRFYKEASKLDAICTSFKWDPDPPCNRPYPRLDF
ncbi:MAG: hypothetical protein LPD71_15015, partial [Shewanella sp.]|nr:hypothetical protein [Shewanella sp.]